MKIKHLYVILTFIIICACVAGAEETKIVVTLNECINIAIQNSQSIKVSEQDKQKALAEYRAARAQRLPYVSSTIRTSQYPKVEKLTKLQEIQQLLPYLSDPQFDAVKTNAGLSQTYAAMFKTKKSFLSNYYNLGIYFGVAAGISIYDAKKNKYVESTRSGIKMSNIQARKVMSDVIYNVKKSYYAYILAAEYTSMREKFLKYYEERNSVIEMNYKRGQKNFSDVTKTKVDLNDAQLELQKAKNNERLAKVDLLRTMGIDDLTTEFDLSREINLPELKYKIEELYKLGSENYSDIQLIKIQKEMAKIRIAMEKAAHLPDVSLSVSGGYENGGLDPTDITNSLKSSNWHPSFHAGFNANIPIYSGGAIQAKVDAAKIEYNKILYREKDAIMGMQMTLQSQYETLQDLFKQMITSQLLLKNAEKQLQISLRLYNNGSISQIEVHDSQMTLLNSEIGYLRIKHDYMMALAKISSIVGLGEDSLCKK